MRRHGAAAFSRFASPRSHNKGHLRAEGGAKFSENCAELRAELRAELPRTTLLITNILSPFSTGAYWADLQDSQAKYTPPP